MHYVGIDLHKQDLVVAVENDFGPVGRPWRCRCGDVGPIAEHFLALRPFQAVIEASSSYRWLYELLNPLGYVVLAHPSKLRAIVAGRAKTDKLDAALLARLLRAGLIPKAYIPPERYQQLREVTRTRARLAQAATQAKNQVHHLLRQRNLHLPVKTMFSKAGRRHLAELNLGVSGNVSRDELLRRIEHYDRELAVLDKLLGQMADDFPEAAVLASLHGIGWYSALLIVAEIGEPDRFRNARQVGAYAGLTARVHPSGGHAYYGHIARQGSRWLRWILVQAAIKLVRRDKALKNFYTRLRKRSGRNVARVAVARKLAGICWIRLRQWHREVAAA